jgi:hypothetical protein
LERRWGKIEEKRQQIERIDVKGRRRKGEKEFRGSFWA